MDRRNVLRYTALLTGSAVLAPVALSLSSCKPDQLKKATNFSPGYFNQEEFDMIHTLVDVILPRTDSPSATDVGVDQMIDHMVGKVYIKENQKEYQENLSKLFAYAQAQSESKGIETLSVKDQEAFVLNLEKTKDQDISKAYQALKQQTIAYYLTTEEVGTKFLNYLPVPGEYEGCIELSSVGGKAWAL